MSKRIVLASGCNESYYPQMQTFMQSVCKNNTRADAFIVGVGWKPPDELSFKGLELPLEKCGGHGGTSWCVQHGGFLHVLPADDDDIVVFTDGGDIVMQRDFSLGELLALSVIRHGEVMLGPDMGQKLGPDAPRLRRPELLHIPLPEKFTRTLPVYNTGVVICTKLTYQKLYARYMREWPLIDDLFSQYARQQWLMSWIVGADPFFTVKPMPHSMHTHGHAPLPFGSYFLNRTLYYKRTVVLFRHRVADPVGNERYRSRWHGRV